MSIPQNIVKGVIKLVLSHLTVCLSKLPRRLTAALCHPDMDKITGIKERKVSLK